MNIVKWGKITTGILIVYGIFLLFQVFWAGWSEVQPTLGLKVAKIIYGIFLLCWGYVFIKLYGKSR